MFYPFLVIFLPVILSSSKWQNIFQVVLRHYSNPPSLPEEKERVKEIQYSSMFLIVDGKAVLRMNEGAENDKILYN